MGWQRTLAILRDFEVRAIYMSAVQFLRTAMQIWLLETGERHDVCN